MEILLIEDDLETADHTARALTNHGHEVHVVHDGLEGLRRAREQGYAVLIVDRMLPSLDGLTLVRQLRAGQVLTPVLFLSTMSGLTDRVEGLEAGGDDYLAKPFALAELLARVNAITRRVHDQGSEVSRLKFADIEMDVIRRTVRRAGTEVSLPEQEFKLLEYLLRNASRVVTRMMLLENVWDLHFDPRTNVVETHLSRLRSKIDRGFQSDLIHTIRGTGYILEDRSHDPSDAARRIAEKAES